VPTHRSSQVPELFAHQPPPRADGVLPVTVTHLEITSSAWTQRGREPSLSVDIEWVAAPSAVQYRELYDRIGRPWLWYERRLLSDAHLARLLAEADHELHVARHDGDLVGYFELAHDELVFFGLTLAYIGRRIGPWLLDRAVSRAFERGIDPLRLNTNTVDHPQALDTYCKAGFRIVRHEQKDLEDPRVRWPDLYRWPPQ
jgi:GNAT superfamily N-acetyltransferase